MIVIMFESVCKGLWKVSVEQVVELVKLYMEMVNKYCLLCLGFVCDNVKLCEYIVFKLDVLVVVQYKENIFKICEVKVLGDVKGMVMKKEEINWILEE